MTTDVQTPLGLFLDLINPVKHYCTNQIWGAVIRMLARPEQLRLCSTCSKQQPSSLVSWDFPPLCHSTTESLWVNTWVRARVCARINEVCASMCACAHEYAHLIMQHIQIWKKNVCLFILTIQHSIWHWSKWFGSQRIHPLICSHAKF